MHSELDERAPSEPHENCWRKPLTSSALEVLELSSMTTKHDPIACTLTTIDAARQGLEWTTLQSQALSATGIDGGAVMTFELDLADSVEDLAARERFCCGFLSITTTRSDDEIRLEITSDSPGARPVIEALAGVDHR